MAARWGGHLSLSIAAVLAPLLVLEAAFRVFGPIVPGNYNTGRYVVPDERYGRFHIPGFRGWVKTHEFTTHLRINGLGLRGPERAYAKSEGVRRILLLGDSFVEAVQVPEEATVASRLETAFNANAPGPDRYEVLNAGIGGWGTGQQLVYLREEGLRYQPDLIVLVLFVGNDVFDNSYLLQGQPKSFHEPYFVFKPDGSFEPMKFRMRKPEDVNPVVGWLRGHSQGWNALESGVLDKLRVTDDTPELRANRFNMNKMLIHRLKSNDRQDEAWRTTLTLLQRVRQLGDERGIPTAVVIAPASFQVYDDEWTRLLDEQDLRPDEWAADLPNAVLAANASMIGAPMLDLLPAFTTEAADGPRLYYAYDKHWTAAGHAVAAREIEAFIVDQKLLPGE